MWILGIQLKQKVEAEDDQEKFRLLKIYYESGKQCRGQWISIIQWTVTLTVNEKDI